MKKPKKKKKSRKKRKPTTRRSGESSGGKIRFAIAAVAILGLVWLLLPKSSSSPPELDGLHSIGPGAGTVGPAEPGTLVVRVLWDDGRRADGALVRIERPEEGDRTAQDFTVRTNEHGVARFEDIPAGEVGIGVVRRGDARDWVTVESGEPLVFLVHLPAGLTVVGDVIDELGQPIADASIWISEPWDRLNGHVVTKSDDDGKFRVRAVGLDGLHWLWASASDRAATGVRDFRGEPGDEVSTRFVLGRTGALVSGEITGPEGVPVEGARVLVGHASPAWAAAPHGSAPRRATTGAGGLFRLESVPLGTVPIHVRAPGFAPHFDVLDVSEGANDVSVELVPESRVVGRVSDVEGKSVPEARIYSHGPGAPLSSETTAGRGGRFELVGLESGRVRLVAWHPDRGRAETVLRLASGQAVEWSPVLEPAPRIFGTLVDADGEPIARRELALWATEPVLRDGRTTLTDSTGKFSFGDVPDRSHLILAHDLATEPSFPSLVLDAVRPSLEPLDLVLPTAADTMGVVVGRVVDAGGEPVSHAAATFTHSESGLEETASTDADGRFGIHLPPGAFSLRITSAREPRLDMEGELIDVGERVDLGDVRLPPPATVSGSLLDVPDTLLGSIRMEWLRPDGEELGRGTLVHRDYASPPLGPGRVVLKLHGDFLEKIEVEFGVKEGVDRELDLRPRPAGLRRVLVELPDTDRPDWLWVEVEDKERSVRWSWAGAPTPTGPTELRVSVPPGEYRIRGGTDTGLFIGARLNVDGDDGDQEPLRLRAR